MSTRNVLVLFQLGNSFPQDEGIEDELICRLTLPYLRHRQFLNLHHRGVHMQRIATRVRSLRRALASYGERQVILVGRSSGARVITKLAAEGLPQIRGVICIGYPLHSPYEATHDPDRTDHLPLLDLPTLIAQGDQDEYGAGAAVRAYIRSPQVDVLSFPGEHQPDPDTFPWDAVADRIRAMAEAAPPVGRPSPAVVKRPAGSRLRAMADPAWWNDLRAMLVGEIRRLMR